MAKTNMAMVLASIVVAAVAARAELRRPRPVVLIVADDLRPSFSFLGVAGAQTPRIDALAAEGVYFSRAFCQAPTCSPSRTSFLTGLHPDVSADLRGVGRVRGGGGRARRPRRLHAHAVPRLPDARRRQALALGGVLPGQPLLAGERRARAPASFFFLFRLAVASRRRRARRYYPARYSQAWGCVEADGDGRCSPTGAEFYERGQVYLADDGSRLFDARVAAKAAEKVAVGAEAWRAARTPFLLGVGFHHPRPPWRVPTETSPDEAGALLRTPAADPSLDAGTFAGVKICL